MIYATPITFASGGQMLHGALFEKTAPLDPSQKLFINKRRGQANCRSSFAHLHPPSLFLGEVKNREVKKFSLDEIKEFQIKFAEIKKLENLVRVVGFIFSRTGFTGEAEAYCQEKGIACSEDERWLESGKPIL